MARGFREQVNQSVADSPLKLGPGLLVFVSFSLPEPTLHRLIDQAARVGGTLILRGFIDGSMQATSLRVRELIGNRQVGFQIDPQLFDKYGVTSAPTFVVVTGSDADGCKGMACAKAERFAAVAGDVSVDYALEFVVKQSSAMRPAASKLLARYRTGTPS
jgi:conjugal transfer pilus assembly protein TrbC